MTTLVVGVGHPDRGDDAVGAMVAEALATTPGVVVRWAVGDPTRMLEDPLWTTAERVVVVDGVRTGAPVGTVQCWSARDLVRPGATVSADTHGLGLVATIALADTLGRLPEALEVVGVEVGDVTLGQAPSPEVVAAVPRAVAAVLGGGEPPA